MKNKQFCIAILFLCIIIQFSCAREKETIRQQTEISTVYNGKAVITDIRPAKTGSGSDDGNYVEIYYDFVPVKNGVPVYSEIESSGRMLKLFYDNRDIFHINWVKKWDIKSGNLYPAVRRLTKKENKINFVTYEVFIEPEKK